MNCTVAPDKISPLLAIAFALGLGLGLLWRPYSLATQKLGPASAMLKCNRITGRCWILSPGQTEWQIVEHAWKPKEATAVPDWAK